MYNSKYYTCEQIDQRLLEGYYDDAVAAGYIGSKAQYLAGLLKAINYSANPTITADKVVYNPAISGLTHKNIQDAIDEVSSIGYFAKRGGIVNISTNYNSTNTAEVLTLEQAIAKVPSKDRVLGFTMTFNSSDGWKIYQFISDSVINWTDTTKWVSILNSGEILQELGNSKTGLISQKAASSLFNSLCFILQGEKVISVDFNNKKVHILRSNVIMNYGANNQYGAFNDVNTNDIDIPRFGGLFIIGFNLAKHKFVFLPYGDLPNKDIYTVAVGYISDQHKIFFSTSDLLVNGQVLKPLFNETEMQQEIQQEILSWHISVYKDERKQKALRYAPNLFNEDVSVIEGTNSFMYLPVKPNTKYATNTAVRDAIVYDRNLNAIKRITWSAAESSFTTPDFEDEEGYMKIYVPTLYTNIMVFVEGPVTSTGKSIHYYGQNSKDNSILGIDKSLLKLILGIRVEGLHEDTLCIGYVNKNSNNSFSISLNNVPNLDNPGDYGIVDTISIPTTDKKGVQFVEGNEFSVLVDFDYLATLKAGVISNNLSGNYVNPDMIQVKPNLQIIKRGLVTKIPRYIIQDNQGFRKDRGGEILLIEIDNIADTTNQLLQLVWKNLDFGDSPSTEYKYYAFFENDSLDNSGFISSAAVPNSSPNGGILNTDIPKNAKYFALTTSFKVKSPNAELVDITKPYYNKELLSSISGVDVLTSKFVSNPPKGSNLLDVNTYYPVQVGWSGVLIRHTDSKKSSIIYIDSSKSSLVISGFKTRTKSDGRVWRFFSYKGEELGKGYVSYDQSLVTEGVEIVIPPLVVPIPDDAFVMVITTDSGDGNVYDLSTAKIEYGTKATSYLPYKGYPQIFDGAKQSVTKNVKFSRIYWDVYGDSKTAEYSDGVRNWSYYVQEKLGIGIRNNYATSGARWEDFETSVPRQRFSQQVIDAIKYNDGHNLTPDIITLSFGTNSLNAVVGDFDTIMAIDWGEDGSSLDRTTVFGGMRWGIETLKRKYPNAIFLASSPLPRNGSVDSKIPTMMNNMKKMLSAYGIPMIDLYTEGQYSSVIDKTIIKSNPRTDGNWWHYDGLHDSNGGAQITAKVWGSVMYPYLCMI